MAAVTAAMLRAEISEILCTIMLPDVTLHRSLLLAETKAVLHFLRHSINSAPHTANRKPSQMLHVTLLSVTM